MLDIGDIYEVFQIQHKKASYTHEDIKNRFKQLALVYHPDRPTGDPEIFKSIKLYYERLYNLLQMRTADKTHNELKEGVQTHYHKNPQQIQEQFSNDYINKLFEENHNRVREEHISNGYDKYNPKGSLNLNRKEPTIKQRFSISNNETDTNINQKINFHYQKQPLSKSNVQLIKYKKFQEHHNEQTDSYYQLGQEKVCDYNRYKNIQEHDPDRLQYADLKVYQQVFLMDPKLVKKAEQSEKQKLNLQEYENKRSKAKMSERELHEYEKYKQKYLNKIQKQHQQYQSQKDRNEKYNEQIKNLFLCGNKNSL